MKHLPQQTLPIILLISFLASACGSTTPTGVDTSDVRGTWSGAFNEFSLMGRTLSGDGDWTFTRDTFEIIFFNPPEGQAERIEGDWKFADGKIVLVLKSSFPIDTDIGATDTLFVSILRDEMSLKTIAESSILLVKTRIALTTVKASTLFASIAPPLRPEQTRTTLADLLLEAGVSQRSRGLTLEDIRIQSLPQHPPV